jgi:hypothetical protein
MSVTVTKLKWNGVSGMPCAPEEATRITIQTTRKIEPEESLEQRLRLTLSGNQQKCLSFLNWRRKEVQFPKHWVFYSFKIPHNAKVQKSSDSDNTNCQRHILKPTATWSYLFSSVPQEQFLQHARTIMYSGASFFFPILFLGISLSVLKECDEEKYCSFVIHRPAARHHMSVLRSSQVDGTSQLRIPHGDTQLLSNVNLK